MPVIASSEPLERGTLRFARFIVRHRLPVAALLGAATLFFLYPSANAALSALGWELPGPSVRIGARARDLFPDHPFIHAQDKFAETFGNSSLVAVAVVVEEGTIFTPETLAKIKRVTDSLDGEDFETQLRERQELSRRLEEERGVSGVELREEVDRRFPRYPVNHDQIRSIVHRTTRTVEWEVDGGITTKLLIPSLPDTQPEADAIRKTVLEKAPELLGALVSRDQQAALVTASFVTDRLESLETYRAVFDHVYSIVEREEDENHRLFVTGTPIVTGWVLAHAWEIVLSIVGAVALIFGLLWAYFRRWHGVLIPSVAAAVTVIWGLGFIGWMGIVLDPLVLVIPMIITARAVSHTVQMAERFFEDYERLAPRFSDPQRAKLEAASVAMGELIVPGTLGILTDVAGLLVILVTTIPQMRNLGIFGAFWVAAIVFTVEILHPVLICALPPPREHRHHTPRLVVRFTEGIATLVTHRTGKWMVAGVTLVSFCAAGFVTLRYSRIGDANPGVSLFWPDHPVNVATGVIGERFGGVDALVIYGEGDRFDSVGEQRFLLVLEELERTLRHDSGATGSLSLPLLVHSAQQLFHGGDPKFGFVPRGSREWVYMMRTNSPPGALGPIVDPSGRATAATIYYRDHKGETIERAVRVAERFIAENPIGEISIRLERDRARPGAAVTDPERMVDFAYYMVGPLLPTRGHTLRVAHRTEQGYQDLPVMEAAAHGLPPWIEEFREAALERYQDERLAPSARRPFPLAGGSRGLGSERCGPVVGRCQLRRPCRRGEHARSPGPGSPEPRRPRPDPPADPRVDAGRPLPARGGSDGDPFRREPGGRARTPGQHLPHPPGDLSPPLRDLPIASERRDRPAADFHRHALLARLHGRARRWPQHQHPAGPGGGGRDRRRLRHLHHRPDPPGSERHRRRRRGHPPRRVHDGEGRDLHGDHGGGRDPLLGLLQPALSGRDGAASLCADDRQHARRDHRGTRLLLDRAPEAGHLTVARAGRGRATIWDPRPASTRGRAIWGSRGGRRTSRDQSLEDSTGLPSPGAPGGPAEPVPQMRSSDSSTGNPSAEEMSASARFSGSERTPSAFATTAPTYSIRSPCSSSPRKDETESIASRRPSTDSAVMRST